MEDQSFKQIAAEAIGIERIIVYGFILILLVTVGGSLFLSRVPIVDAETNKTVLSYFKDFSLILAGALTGFLAPKKKE